MNYIMGVDGNVNGYASVVSNHVPSNPSESERETNGLCFVIFTIKYPSMGFYGSFYG
jgi:hypothetical protein